MINNKNVTRDQLKEILEDELFQNLLFHTADVNCSTIFTRHNKYHLKENLTDDDLKSINFEIRLREPDEPNQCDYFAIVALYFLKDDVNKSIDYLEKFLEIYDKPIENNLKEILTEYAFKAADYSNRYEEDGSIFSKAQHFVFTRNYQKAIPILEKILDSANKQKEKSTLYLLAYSYFEINQFDDAMKYFNIFLSLYPDYLNINGLLGDYYNNVGEYEKAIEFYNIEKEYFYKHLQPVKDNKRTTYDYLRLMHCYREVGKIDELMQYFEERLSSTPDNEVLWTYLAICYQVKEAYDKAFEMVDKALSINPNYSEALKVLGVNYYHKESYNRALYYFNESIKIKYDDFNSNYYLGCTYIKTKDHSNAISIFKFILRIWSNCGLSYFALGSIYAHLGKEELALECFEKADKFKPFYLNEYTKIITVR